MSTRTIVVESLHELGLGNPTLILSNPISGMSSCCMRTEIRVGRILSWVTTIPSVSLCGTQGAAPVKMILVLRCCQHVLQLSREGYPLPGTFMGPGGGRGGSSDKPYGPIKGLIRACLVSPHDKWKLPTSTQVQRCVARRAFENAGLRILCEARSHCERMCGSELTKAKRFVWFPFFGDRWGN